MGEKGNELDHGLAAISAVTSGTTAEPSVIERVTTTTTQTIVGAAEDVVAKLKDKAIDHGSDAVIDEARGRLGRRDGPVDETTGGDDDAAR